MPWVTLSPLDTVDPDLIYQSKERRSMFKLLAMHNDPFQVICDTTVILCQQEVKATSIKTAEQEAYIDARKPCWIVQPTSANAMV